MATRFGLPALLVLSGALFTTVPALAKDKTASDESSASADSSDANEASESDKDKDSDKEADESKDKKKSEDTDSNRSVAPTANEASSPVEDAGKTYYFLGARYRLIVVPKFILNMFASGGTTVAVHSGGPEFGIRKAGFEVNFAAWLAAYSMDPTPFKAKSDGEDAWEVVESRIKVAYLTADLLWSHSFSPEFALNYGMGAGLGVVWGPLYRNQAYRTPTGSYAKCVAPGNPSGLYCGNDNNHYGNYQEPSWANGGSKPFVFPWLAVQTGLRYKPHKNFAARLDLGFGLSGFFFGLGADYGL